MENIENKSLNKKIIANAVSSYFFICFSWLFLFNKSNEYLNNNFVKSHVKSSTLIHLGFIITYIIFISNSLFAIEIYGGFFLNDIIAKVLFLFLLFLLVMGAYKAHSEKHFLTTNDLNIVINKDKFIDLNGDSKFDEKDKLTIIFAYIPFIGFLNFGKYKNNKLLEDITKQNIIITFIILLLYIYNHNDLSNLLLLFYTIYVVFIGINLFIRDEIIKINTDKIPSPKALTIQIKAFLKYLNIYFKNSNFTNFKDILNNEIENNKKQIIEEQEKIKKLNTIKGPTFLIYIPIINIFYIFLKENKYKNHIHNGFTITLITILYIILKYFDLINYGILALLIIPITFGIGYLNYDLTYKMPFIHEIYELLIGTKNLIFLKSSKVNELRKKDETISLKIEK